MIGGNLGRIDADGFDGVDRLQRPLDLRPAADGEQDFSVTWSDGLFELVEVKYRADLCENWSKLRPGFSAACDRAHEAGGRFRIAMERGIRGPRLENARRLLPLKRVTVDSDAAERAVQVVRSSVAPTFGGIVAAIGCDRVFALGVVWRLIARGVLKVDLNAPIRLDTPVRLS